MENPNLEYDNSDSREEIIADVIEDISYYFAAGDITDDNPSEVNGYTSLEEILLFELAEYLNETIELDRIKAQIVLRAWEIYEFDDTQIDELMSREEEDWEEEWYEINEEEEEEYLKKTINKIAKYYLVGNISDSNYSTSNGLSTLNQIILYKTGLFFDDDEDYFRFIERLKHQISLLNSGSSLAKIPRYTRSGLNRGFN